MSSQSKKTCLLVSYGPVPTPESQVIEGTGMRYWGLAVGLKANGVDVTVGVHHSFPQKISEHEGVKLLNWQLDDDFIKLINSYDSVVVSYCAGEPSEFIAKNINDNVQLILDAYVPIYIEVSARDSADVTTEYMNYMTGIQGFNKVLKRGDFFLSANPAQDMFYSGVLSALGIINPHSYRQQRILSTPFGIHRKSIDSKVNPYKDLGIQDNGFVVLWFGGIYPWFHIQEYLDSIDELSSDKKIKFVFVGGKNPFNPNPDLSRQYDTAVSFAKQAKLLDKQVFFVDWVDFDTRIDWFHHADVVVSLNQPGDENKFSWRTRVMDFVWGEVAIITNGTDPLSEELLDNDAAMRIDNLSKEDITEAIIALKQQPKKLKTIRANLLDIKEKYYWDVTTKTLATEISKQSLPYLEEKRFSLPLKLDQRSSVSSSLTSISGVTGLPLKIVRKVRQKGIRRSAKVASSMVKTQLKGAVRTKREPQFIFISHPINNTGAPIVLIQIIEEFVKKYGSKRVRVIAPGVEKKQEVMLRNMGILVEQAVFASGFRFIRLQLGIQKDDFVLINTVAIYHNYRDFILLWLKLGRLKHAFWFIHEDIAQLPLMDENFMGKRNVSRLKKLVDNESLSLLFPSKRTAKEYGELLDISRTDVINLHIEVDEKYKKTHDEKYYDTINFIISGAPGDGRKGQLLALAAFYTFIKDYYEKNPKDYRPFKLHLVAVADDYISQQIKWISNSQLKGFVEISPSVPKKTALEIASKCNVAICCSLNETFVLYIAEGMQMGHIVLRNKSAGVDEQLQDGVNGYLIDEKDITQFSSVIEKVLNKKKTSNKTLMEMGVKSQEMMKPYANSSYLDSLGL
jgi:glycosyltransferase involved in cell wall biosynthesis